MQNVMPFRAWRYSAQAGALADLVAPPYDVIGPDLRARLYARSSYNVVRVDLGITTPSDSEYDNQYTRAARQLKVWKNSGILVRDSTPSLTFVEESFTGPDGRASMRHGFLAAIRLFEFDEGIVFPHEHTLSGPKEDRYRLTTATKMSLSPIFLLYDLPSDTITAAWRARRSRDEPAAVVEDEEGTVTRLWPTSQLGLLEVVSHNLADASFLIADGHHRYETALRYWQAHRTPAAEYALAYFSNMSDPGLTIYATHRLLTGLEPQQVTNLPAALAEDFVVQELSGAGAAGAHAAVAEYLAAHPRQAFGLWSPELPAPYGFHLAARGVAQAEVSAHSDAYRDLDVTVLQDLVLEKALAISPEDMASERYVTYFKDPTEAFAQLEAGAFQVGFFMNPTGLDQVREVAFGGERMPQKATFFYPKLPTGLVLLDLSGRL